MTHTPAKNKTRYKSLNIVNDDPRVDQVFDEGEDGLWLWLKPGYTCDERGAHDGHEWNVRDLLRVYRGIKTCVCDECRTAIEKQRCTYEDVQKSEGRECYRRCTRDVNHEGRHFMSSWCLR